MRNRPQNAVKGLCYGAGQGEAAKLSHLIWSHSLKLFGRLFYTHAYEDVFGSEDVFAKELTSLIIRPGILCCLKETDMDL